MELETTFVVPVAKGCFIHLPCEDEWFIDIFVPRSSYSLVDPIPFSLSPKAVRPPAVHAAPDDRRIELAVFALFIENV